MLIDARFQGFVDTTPPPPFLSGGTGYTLTRRNGTHVNCDPSFLMTSLDASPFDPCNFPAPGMPVPTSKLAPAANVTPPSF
ncbi:MAG TPA: hypothetical protein VH914_12365 [Acidimicrobiia bacterium]|nr:hypothetical protein [Acidimicrobiia bacterium]